MYTYIPATVYTHYIVYYYKKALTEGMIALLHDSFQTEEVFGVSSDSGLDSIA